MVGAPPDQLVRSQISNLNAPLAYREMLASEIAKDIKFSELKFAKTSIVMEKGKPVGVMSEWSNGYIEEAKYSGTVEWAAKYKPIDDETRMEMTIYDLLIGNTDRHTRNYLRNTRTGKTLAIDHGYSFPEQYSYQSISDVGFPEESIRFDWDGLNPEWKSIPSTSMKEGFDWVVDEDNYDRILSKIEKLDIQGMGERYGLAASETRALEMRRRVVMRLMVEKRVGEYMESYHRTGDWPDMSYWGLDNLTVDLDKNVWEADIP
jgi:hypothetical protein